MARKPGPHLMKPGSYVWLVGERVLATWCGTHVERDDVNGHAIDKVKCKTCLNAFYKAQG